MVLLHKKAMRPLIRVLRWVTITKIFIVVKVAVILVDSFIFLGEYRKGYKKGKKKIKSV